MSVDKKIDYVAQDGVKNYIKNSQSVTVPKKFKARKNAPATKLAYITDAEAKMLKQKKKGTPHKGPKGIPSYDSFDADGNFTSGAAMSAAETGDRSATGRRDVSSEFGPKGLAPGVTPNEARDLRSAAIAAGAGQRVNPGFFDSRNVISPAELARARAFAKTSPFAKTAMRKTRGGGLLGLLSSGGILGNIIRSLGQRFGLGKKFNQPTYDMSEGNKLGLFGQVPEDFEDDAKISNVSFTANDPNNILNQIPVDTGIKTIAPNNILANTGDAFDYFNLDNEDLSGIKTIPSGSPFDNPFKAPTPTDNFLEGLPQDTINNLMAEVMQDDINKSKTRTFKAMDFDTYKMLNPNSQITPFEFQQLKEGNIKEPGTYTV